MLSSYLCIQPKIETCPCSHYCRLKCSM